MAFLGHERRDIRSQIGKERLRLEEKSLEFFLQKPPFTKGDVKRLGKCLRENSPIETEKRTQIELWYGMLGQHAHNVVKGAIQCVMGEELGARSIKTSAMRIKTDQTIVEKLGRGTHNLSVMQDYMGVRFDLDCYHEELRQIAARTKDQFSFYGVEVQIKDLIENPHAGYRAIHLHITSNESGRVEVQLRTLLQGKWANAYEKLADVVGREIRYGQAVEEQSSGYRKLVSDLQQLSEQIVGLERSSYDRFKSERDWLEKRRDGLRQTCEALPLSSELYELHARTYHLMSESMLDIARAASQNLKLIQALESIEQCMLALKQAIRKEKEQ